MKKIILTVVTFAIILGCNPTSDTKKDTKKDTKNSTEYAVGFEITQYKNYKKLMVKNPWQSSKNNFYEFFLFKKNTPVPDSLADKKIIFTPIKRAVCLSTTYLGFIEALHQHKSVVGISGISFVYDSTINSMIKNEEIVEIGYEQNLNIEKIIKLSPDVVFAYDITGSLSTKYDQLRQLGIEVVLIGEYLETHPLGRAEWLKFFAAFYELDSIAQLKFADIAIKYNVIKKQFSGNKSAPGVLVNVPFQGIWYLPGGNSYLSNFISDAHGNYLWKNIKKTESFSISFENILLKNDSIDILLNPGTCNSIAEIINIDKRIEHLNCVSTTKKVFNDTKRCKINGSKDIYESGVVNPHLVLKDLALIFNNSSISNDSLYYYERIN